MFGYGSRKHGVSRRIVASTAAGAFVALAATAVVAVAGTGSSATTNFQSATAVSNCNPSWTWSPLPDLGLQNERISNLAASSAADAWAIGDATSVASFLLHWNGTNWTSVSEPDGVLAVAATAISPSDAWIAGTKLAHWDGSNWTVVASPSGANVIAAVSNNDVWAVGDDSFLHWDGSAWTAVPMPVPASDADVLALAPVSSDDVWAVGGQPGVTLIEHWDGKSWSVVPSPNVTGDGVVGNGLLSVAAVSATDVWAVGLTTYQTDPDSDQYARTLTEHWDGTKWSIVASPNSDAIHVDSRLRGVAAVSSGDVWAVGGSGPYILHWDGARWSRVITVAPTTANLFALAAVKDGTVFAAGSGTASLCEAVVSSAGVTPAKANGTAAGSSVVWHFAQAGRIVDGSGLGLFDSGARAAGGSYMTRLASAATYPVTDTASGASARVGVGLVVKPTSGTTQTQFGIGWGSDLPLPAGDVTDVQVARPNVPGGWVDWLRGQTLGGAYFVPDAGAGTYQFRVRVRNMTTGATSGWSTTRQIHVS